MHHTKDRKIKVNYKAPNNQLQSSRQTDRQKMCLCNPEDRKIKANYKVPNKQLHRDRRSLVPILHPKITLCDVVCWWFAVVVAVVACLTNTQVYCRAGIDPAETPHIRYAANPPGSRLWSQKRLCTAVCERRATTSLTPLAMLLQGDPTFVLQQGTYIRRVWYIYPDTCFFHDSLQQLKDGKGDRPKGP